MKLSLSTACRAEAVAFLPQTFMCLFSAHCQILQICFSSRAPKRKTRLATSTRTALLAALEKTTLTSLLQPVEPAEPATVWIPRSGNFRCNMLQSSATIHLYSSHRPGRFHWEQFRLRAGHLRHSAALTGHIDFTNHVVVSCNFHAKTSAQALTGLRLSWP